MAKRQQHEKDGSSTSAQPPAPTVRQRPRSTYAAQVTAGPSASWNAFTEGVGRIRGHDQPVCVPCPPPPSCPAPSPAPARCCTAPLQARARDRLGHDCRSRDRPRHRRRRGAPRPAWAGGVTIPSVPYCSSTARFCPSARVKPRRGARVPRSNCCNICLARLLVEVHIPGSRPASPRPPNPSTGILDAVP